MKKKIKIGNFKNFEIGLIYYGQTFYYPFVLNRIKDGVDPFPGALI